MFSSHHEHKDSVSRFKERNLNAIVYRRKMEKWLKVLLIILAIVMVILVVIAYLLG